MIYIYMYIVCVFPSHLAGAFYFTWPLCFLRKRRVGSEAEGVAKSCTDELLVQHVHGQERLPSVASNQE